ncbi:FecCD family ABC transporter permease [Clostridioides difficile]
MDFINKNRMKNTTIFITLILGVILTFFICVAFGSVKIEFKEIIDVVLRGIDSTEHYKIIYNIRIPRVLATMVGGACLAVSGILLQIFFKNPIVEPYILGVSSGATLSVALMILGGYTLGFESINSMSIFIAAFAGALIVMSIVILFASKVKNITTLLVIGIMTGYVCSGITNILQSFAANEKLKEFTMWSMGSFSGFTWEKVKILMIVGILGLLMSIFIIKPLNAFLLGEEYAKSIGVNTKFFRFLVVFISSILAAIVSAFAGPIGFIGLAVPQISKLIFRTSDNRVLIPVVILLGSIVTALCDLVSRVILSPIELPISAITSLLGAPIVIMLLMKRKDRA